MDDIPDFAALDQRAVAGLYDSLGLAFTSDDQGGAESKFTSEFAALLPTHEDEWTSCLQTAVDCGAVEVPTARALVKHLMHRRREHIAEGIYYVVQRPKAAIRAQRQQLYEGFRCAHCGQFHPMITVQTIAVETARQGHGTRLIRELCEGGYGVYLQSAISPGGAALARRLRMTPKPYEQFSFHYCLNR